MNIAVHASFQIRVFVFCIYVAKNGIVGSYVNSVFSFQRPSIPLSIMAAPIYIPTNSVGWFLFSIPPPIFIICKLLIMAALTVMRWKLIIVLTCISLIAMLNIFSYGCWPFVCLLWRNVYVGLVSIFWSVCLGFVFILSCMRCLYILQIKH